MNDGYYFECIVRFCNKIEKIVRYFESVKWAYTWLTLEGYDVIYLKIIDEV